MIQAIIKMELNPLSENPDERIMEAITQSQKIIREINMNNDYPKMELFCIKNKRDDITFDDLRGIDEAKELRMMRGTADECDEEFV